MSLAEKFEKYLFEAGKGGQRLFGFEDLQRALYFGAEATLNYCNLTSPKAMQMVEHEEIQAEIDHFRSHK